MEDVPKDAELTEEDLRALESPRGDAEVLRVPRDPAFGTAGSDAFDAARNSPERPNRSATSPRAVSDAAPARPRPVHVPNARRAAQDRAQVGRGESASCT